MTNEVRRSGLVIIVLAMMCVGLVCGTDSSATREWAFEMEKIWELRQIGEEEMLRPAEPRIADDGTLYFHDFDRHLSYIVSADGDPVGTFAARGSNEGDVPMYLNCFTAGDYVVICSMDRLHFFTRQGEFVSEVPNNPFVRFPLAFKSETEFWVAPGALGDSPGGSATITHIDLASAEETIIHEFELTDDESKPTGGGVVVGLTPQANLAYDRPSDQIYFGKNSDTVVYTVAGDGTVVEAFSFVGVSRPVSEQDKRDHFSRFNVPEERLAAMIGSLPDRMAHYNRIQVIDGLVYMLCAESLSHNLTSQVVDVYTLDGRHLYQGRIQLEEGWHISGSNNLQLANGFVYAIEENSAGDKRVVKYAVELPRQ